MMIKRSSSSSTAGQNKLIPRQFFDSVIVVSKALRAGSLSYSRMSHLAKNSPGTNILVNFASRQRKKFTALTKSVNATKLFFVVSAEAKYCLV